MQGLPTFLRHSNAGQFAMVFEWVIPVVCSHFTITQFIASHNSAFLQGKAASDPCDHNANIAVLGDSELLMPMYRENDCGKVVYRGFIDSPPPSTIQNLFEGGPVAFLRRKQIYGH
jgi:hypothetical protein